MLLWNMNWYFPWLWMSRVLVTRRRPNGSHLFRATQDFIWFPWIATMILADLFVQTISIWYTLKLNSVYSVNIILFINVCLEKSQNVCTKKVISSAGKTVGAFFYEFDPATVFLYQHTQKSYIYVKGLDIINNVPCTWFLCHVQIA